MGLLLLSASAALADDCAWTQPIRAQAKAAASIENTIARMQAYTEVDQLRMNAAKNVFSAFLQNRFESTFGDRCLSLIDEAQAFENLMHKSFIEESLRHLRTLPLQRLQKLLQLHNSDSLLFRLTGHGFSAAPGDLRAGIHRATGSIFMNLNRMSPNDWFILLIHELVHFSDNKIAEGITKYSNNELVLRLAQMSQKSSDPKDLPADAKLEFADWAQAAMDRGLLMETRAWTITFLIYLEGLQAKTWQNIAWMDLALKNRGASEPLAEFSYRYLNTQSYQPREGIFANPLAYNLVQEVRNEFAEGKRKIDFGSLAPLLD